MPRKLAVSKQRLAFIQARLDHCEDADLKRLKTAAELHLFAKWYSWGGQARALQWLIRQRACDRGTALMLYWRRDASAYYAEYASASEMSDLVLEEWEVLEEIEERLAKGRYQTSLIGFTPPAVTGKLKRPMPKVVLEPSPGQPFDDPWKVEEH